jgi:hypothetical protein
MKTVSTFHGPDLRTQETDLRVSKTGFRVPKIGFRIPKVDPRIPKMARAWWQGGAIDFICGEQSAP